MEENLHPIKVVSMRTGLSSHVIRIWEKRYGAVKPDRTESNRRLYSDEDIQRLTLMRLASDRGHRIGQLSKMSLAELKELLQEEQQIDRQRNSLTTPVSSTMSPEDLIESALVATRELDDAVLLAALKSSALQFGHQGLLEKVIGPLAGRIGESWLRGDIKVAHEHFASAVIRQFLGEIGRPYVSDPTAPRIVVASPSGQLHELGAVMVNAAAASKGWNCKYIGCNLSAEEIAGAASQVAARAVALSVVFPADDPRLSDEFLRLRHYLPPSTQLIVGGKSAYAYRNAIEKSGGMICTSLREFYPILDRVRVEKFRIDENMMNPPAQNGNGSHRNSHSHQEHGFNRDENGHSAKN
jgi:MerR family transcriptional regulator, light-induced transcriptional regulator